MEAINIWPTDGQAVIPAIRQAINAGIPVVVTNSKITDAGMDFIAAFRPRQCRAGLLLERLRRIYLKRTAFAQAQVNTIRLKLLKIGAVITRAIRLMLSSQYPKQGLFLKLASLVQYPG
ncbi:transposase [Halomonas sp. HK25]|uniref:transposase n=1 Tax=Halomonas sp. HK25 TaxID=3394321 RepID=UPI0039FC55FF